MRKDPIPGRQHAPAARGTTRADPSSPETPGRVPTAWGSFAILEPLGADHFGDCYLARDAGGEVLLRLRPVDPEGDDIREERFLDEARRLAGVHHPNVARVLGADRADGFLGFWTERVRGETLEDKVLRDGPLPVEDARRIGLELCHALTAIHAAGVIHREVRTSAVVRDPGGRIVLLESGALGDLRRRRDEAGSAGVADAYALALAPEQLLGVSVSLSTDVYGLGVLLYRLVSGRFPVESESVIELSEHHNRGLFEPLRDRRPGLPLDFVRVIERAIDPEPARRYPNAVALERALAATLLVAPTEPARRPEPEALRAHPIAVTLAGLERWRSAILSAAALVFGLAIAGLLIAPSPSRVAAPVVVAPPLPDGPPVPAAIAARLPGAGAQAEEPEEQWAYRTPRTTGYGPPLKRGANAPPPPARPSSGPVAGATAVLRALAQGPRMSGDAPAAAETFGSLTLTTVPDHARVSIDGVLQREPTNATYRVEAGQHWVLIEKPGYQPQQLPPLDVAAGQKLRAGVTLAPAPPTTPAPVVADSLATP